MIWCSRAFHHFSTNRFGFFTGDISADSFYNCNTCVRVRDWHTEQPRLTAYPGHSRDASITRRCFQPGRFSLGWNSRRCSYTGGWCCANRMTAGRAEFGGIGDLMTAIFTEHRFEPPIDLNLLQKMPSASRIPRADCWISFDYGKADMLDFVRQSHRSLSDWPHLDSILKYGYHWARVE